MAREGTLSGFVARRFLLGGRSNLFLGTARAAVGSTAVGVAAMIVAMALMSGYTRALEDKLLSSGALVVTPLFFSEPQEHTGFTPEDLLQLENVAEVTYSEAVQGSLRSQSLAEGIDVVVRGVDPGQGRFGGSAEELADQRGGPGVLLGAELAKRLQVGQGDAVELVAWGFSSGSPRFRYRRLEVTGTFQTGFFRYDGSYAIVDRQLLEKVGSVGGLYEVALKPGASIEETVAQASRLLGEDYLVVDWRSSNPGLFTALALQKLALFFILGLIVVVSTFNVATALIVLVREKATDLGVLSALGMSRKSVRAVFVRAGLTLGFSGTLAGIGLGALLSWATNRSGLLEFDAEIAEIYFIRSVPLDVEVADLCAIALFSMVVSLAVSVLASRRAARHRPAWSMRRDG